jgi:DNA modification methylase
VILDPFGGAGTTTLVAKRLGRSSIYVDLNPKYLKMAVDRAGFNYMELFAEHTYEICHMEQAKAK